MSPSGWDLEFLEVFTAVGVAESRVDSPPGTKGAAPETISAGLQSGTFIWQIEFFADVTGFR